MYYSKCSTYSSLSLKFLLDEANFYGCFSVYENLAGEQESISPWLFEKNWFYYPQSALPAQIPDQSVLGPGGRGGGGAGGDTKYNDGLPFFGNHQALSSDQSPQCWRFKLNLIIHHLTADSLPKWNCSAVLVIMQMQAGWLTSSISRDNGPVLFSNRVLARQSVKYC